MKLLIAGKNSYIGCHIAEYVRQQEPNSEICCFSVRDESWRQIDFSGFDAMVFAAAIVHRKDVTDETLYRRINAELPFEVAKKAKTQGVKRFLFLSTAGVFGIDKGLPVGNVIDENTPLRPVGFYGESKLEGERLLETLVDDDFLLSIVRPMNVYGKDCPGNYIPIFKKLTRLTPVLPKAFLNVKQGMVHVEHLAKLCYLALRAEHGGIYHAQDSRAVSSFEIMQAMAKGMGQKKVSLPCHTPWKLLSKLGPVNKLFGGVAYSDAFAACPLGTYADTDPAVMLQKTVENV